MLRLGDALFASRSEFVTSVASVGDLPNVDIPEVAFAGRSNVGKSSLLNNLLGRKSLVKTSKTPGHTRLLNFFSLGEVLHLVDMPGYGYAKAGKGEIIRWQKLSLKYLRGRRHLRLLCLLVDSRRGLLESDRDFCRQLDIAGVGYLLVMTKCDKVPMIEVETLRKKLLSDLGNFSAAYPDILVTSAVDGRGLSDLRAHIAQVIGYSRS